MPGPRSRHVGLIALRWLVRANVVPLPSCRTTSAMLRLGSARPGLAARIRGSSQFRMRPEKMSTYTSRGSRSGAVTPGRL